MTTQLDQYAQVGADTSADPTFPPTLTGGATPSEGSSNWAGDFESALNANYFWMYDDGPGGNNIECTPTDTSGCWGHRDDILMADPGASCYVAMGAAYTELPSAGLSYAEIFVGSCGVAPTDQVLTWNQALTTVGSGGPLAIATTSLLEPAYASGSYSQLLQASDGTGPFSWALTSGTLPPGYALSSDGLLTGPLSGPLGAYSFTISVTDAESPPQSVSATYSLTFPGPPTVPLGVSAVAGAGGEVSVSWTAPENDGGSAISRYTVISSPGDIGCITKSTSCVIKGLNAAATYDFDVSATNATGTGQQSQSNSVLVTSVPGSPSIRVSSKSKGVVAISLIGVVANGGSPITSYQYSLNAKSWITIGKNSHGPFVIRHLSSGTIESLRLRAKNAVGVGTPSKTVKVRVL
jgi:hypothetical protein